MNESAFYFTSADFALAGILHEAAPGAETGVLLVVGGPQYRVGSHRQFVLLARDVAAAGWPVLRFDYRGMGDASGEKIDFETCGDDIRAAVDEFQRRCPSIRQVVIWGLCDAASAACMYAPGDRRISGLVLLNPWVRTPEGEAKTMLKHYYLKRLMSRDFWAKLLRGGVSVSGAVSGVGDQIKSAGSSAGGGSDQPLPERMKNGLAAFKGNRLVILSGRDLVADEFRDRLAADAKWQGLMDANQTESKTIEQANHTFARAEWRDQVSRWTIEWLEKQA